MSGEVKEGKIIYIEPLSIRVGEWLRQEGFRLATGTGLALCPTRLGAPRIPLGAVDSLGILWNDPEARRRFFGLIGSRQRFIGLLHFYDRSSWRFEVYGRKYVDMVTQLAKKLSSAFGAEVTVILAQDSPKFEKYMSDY